MQATGIAELLLPWCEDKVAFYFHTRVGLTSYNSIFNLYDFIFMVMEDFKMVGRFLLSVLIAFSIMDMLCGCSRPQHIPAQTKVQFHFKVPASEDVHSWGAPSASSVSEINCIGIFALYPEDSQKGTCVNASGAEVLQVSTMVGMINPSGPLSGDFLSGRGRTFSLIGIHSSDGTCSSFSSLNEEILSRPMLLGHTTTDLLGQDVTVTINGSFSAAEEFAECSGGPFAMDSGHHYGDGSDGDVTYTSGDHDLDVDSNGIRYGRIIGIDLMVGNVVTLAVATQAASFSPGDKVMWHVDGYGDIVDNCGIATSVRQGGEYNFATVTDVSGSSVTLDTDINGPSTIAVATALASSSSNPHNQWCRMQLVRVPQFRNLTLDPGAILSLSSGYSFANGFGGIMAFMVSGTFNIDGGTISVAGSGYAGGAGSTGGASSGYSIQGAIADVTPFAGGGGGATSIHGGGGGGAQSANAGKGGGSEINGGSQNDCGHIQNCLMMGGGGGGGSGTAFHDGGSGGGSVVITAYRIEVGANSLLSAAGANATPTSSTSDAGGGGGGSILISAGSIVDDSLSLSYNVNGGSGGSNASAYNGGGGAGGQIGIATCDTFNIGFVSTTGGVGGTGGGTGGTVGNNASAPTPIAGECY